VYISASLFDDTRGYVDPFEEPRKKNTGVPYDYLRLFSVICLKKPMVSLMLEKPMANLIIFYTLQETSNDFP
jgi:hypothetical protein